MKSKGDHNALIYNRKYPIRRRLEETSGYKCPNKPSVSLSDTFNNLFNNRSNSRLNNWMLRGGDVDEDLALLKQIEFKNQPSKLLDYQQNHADKLIDILKQNGSALDSSDPGIGKTYIAAYIAKMTNTQPIVICPKNVISKWETVLRDFGVKYIMVVNYELISRGKQYINKSKVKSPYISTIINKKKENKFSYEWNVPKDTMFIFDEAHKCKYLNTHNSQLLLATKRTGNKILLLSGTIVEKPREFTIFAYVLGFSDSIKVINEWLLKLSTPAKTLHALLFSQTSPKASRLSISELGDKFPETQITADTYTMKRSSEIKKQYDDIIKKIEEYKIAGKDNNFIMAKLQTEFRNIELLKIPTFIELTNDYLENNFSVVIFVNYTDTLNILADKLKTTSKIYGGQSLHERDAIIDKFQRDETRIIIANIRAGGVGISLHDVNGKHPRVALISPTQSSTDLMQVLGRVHRAGGKTKSLQRIIFAADTPEEKISKMLYIKLSNLSLLNNGDIESYYINGLIKEVNIDNLMTKSNNDMNIVIDEQLMRISKKNTKNNSSICELFPKLINIISGANTVFVLKGINSLTGVEILFAGEYHSTFEPCKKCEKNCINILDLITYIAHCIRPQLVDFYVEAPYNPYGKNKFDFNITFPIQSRIDKFFNTYKYLLDTKHPSTENIRMHAADVRASYTNEDPLLITYSDMRYLMGLIIYTLPDIGQNKLKPSKNIEVDYENNATFLNNLVTNMKGLAKFLTDDTEKKYQQYIINRHSDILHALKITKQQERFIESYDNSLEIQETVNNIENYIKKWFAERSTNIANWLDSLTKFLTSLDEYDPNTYINKLMYECTYNTDLFYYFSKSEFGSHPADMYCDMLASYMDQYTIYRMLRKFDNKAQNNIVFYGGSFHSRDLCDMILASGSFTLVAKKTSNPDREADCAIVSAV